MIKKIDFYFDFISPYTYIAHRKIKSLSKNIEVNYKPILLGGLHNLGGITAPAFFKPKLKNMINDCKLISNKKKIDFKWNSKFPLNSLNLMRGCLCVSSAKIDKYINIMFNAYWRDNLDVSNEKTLIFLLKKCEIDTHKFFNKIKDPAIKDKLKDVTNRDNKKKSFWSPNIYC